MKYFSLFLILFSTNLLAQKPEISFPYKHTSAIDLCNDKEWVQTNVANFLPLFKQSTKYTVLNEILALIVLNKNETALKLLNATPINFDFAKKPKPMNSILYSYLTIAITRKNNYYETIKNKFASLQPALDDEEYMSFQRIESENEYNNMAWGKNDTAFFNKIFNSRISSLNRPKKELSFNEMSLITRLLGYRKIAIAVKVGQDKFTTELENNLKVKLKEYSTIWTEREYNFSKNDTPQKVIAANYQLYDRNDFPATNIWYAENKLEENGIMFLKDKRLNKVVIPANKEMASLYFNKEDLENTGFMHGNMSVELMLKGNPTVQIMGLEHNQYDMVWGEIQQVFTNDIATNRKIIDSLINLRIQIWRELALYCNQNSVRVAEINSLGFLLKSKEFNLTGCGKDKIETEQFAAQKFDELTAGLEKAFLLSPNTLFVIAAGNDNVNTDTTKYLCTNINTVNTLKVGALYKDLKKASYSNYGKKVEVYAPAHFALTNKHTYSESSGTSAAAPVVCNLALKLFCLAPTLTAKQAKEIIINSSNKDLFEKGINVINPKKAIEIMKTKFKIK